MAKLEDIVRADAELMGVKFCPWSKSARVGYNASSWVLRRFGWAPEWAWLTQDPYIYHPDSFIDPPSQMPELCAHEMVHIRQQRASWLWWWNLKYLGSDTFRLRMEKAAYLVDVRNGRYLEREAAKEIATNYHIGNVDVESLTGWFRANA